MATSYFAAVFFVILSGSIVSSQYGGANNDCARDAPYKEIFRNLAKGFRRIDQLRDAMQCDVGSKAGRFQTIVDRIASDTDFLLHRNLDPKTLADRCVASINQIYTDNRGAQFYAFHEIDNSKPLAGEMMYKEAVQFLGKAEIDTIDAANRSHTVPNPTKWQAEAVKIIRNFMCEVADIIRTNSTQRCVELFPLINQDMINIYASPDDNSYNCDPDAATLAYIKSPLPDYCDFGLFEHPAKPGRNPTCAR